MKTGTKSPTIKFNDISERPSAIDFGISRCQIGKLLYLSDGEEWILDSIDDSHNWGERTAVQAGKGLNFFPDYMMLAYSNGEQFIPLNGYLGIADAAAQTLTANFSPGGQISIPIASPGNYLISTDSDMYIKSSNSGVNYGMNLNDKVGGYSTTPASLASQTGLNFGANSWTVMVEFTCLKSFVSGNRLISFGITGGPLITLFATYSEEDINLRPGIVISGDSGAAFKNSSQNFNAGILYLLDGRKYTLTWVITRASGGGTWIIECYIDKLKVYEWTGTEAATPVQINLNSSTSTSSSLRIGETIGGVSQFNGTILSISFWKTALTASNIGKRIDAGGINAMDLSNTLDAKSQYISWCVKGNDVNSWDNHLYPQCVKVGPSGSELGNAVFNSILGTPGIAELSAGKAATANDMLIRADYPQMCYLSGAYLNVLSNSIRAGRVQLTPMV